MPVVTQVICQASRDSRQSDPGIWLLLMCYPTSLLYLLGNYAKLSVFCRERFFFFLKKMIGISEEDPLEKEMATCSSIFTWEISWTGEPGGLHVLF